MSDAVVHVIDDDAAFLTAVARLLRASGFPVKTFASAAEFLAQLDGDTRGCVVADLQMPDMSGLELQAALARAHDAIPLIFLTGQGDIPASVQAMRGGAEDFLEKLGPKEELLAAVQRALARDLRGGEARDQRRAAHIRFATLSPREREVLGQVVHGRLNKQIGDSLGIAERTVKAHRKAITTKLGVPSVAELTRLTLDAGFFPDDSPARSKKPSAAAPAPNLLSNSHSEHAISHRGPLRSPPHRPG